MKKGGLLAFLIIILLLNILSISSIKIEAENLYFTDLVLKCTICGDQNLADFALFTAQDLREIGINTEIKIYDCLCPYNPFLLRDFDLLMLKISYDDISPDLRFLYDEEGSLNFAGITSDIPYGTNSADLLKEGSIKMNASERKQIYNEWQELVMNRLLLVLPFYAYRNYGIIWSNTKNFDYIWGWVDSCPYMSYDGLHDGQDSLEEWNTADSMWIELNPMFSVDTASKNIVEYQFESGIEINPNLELIKTGLIYDWEQISSHHYKYYVRDSRGIILQESYL